MARTYRTFKAERADGTPICGGIVMVDPTDSDEPALAQTMADRNISHLGTIQIIGEPSMLWQRVQHEDKWLLFIDVTDDTAHQLVVAFLNRHGIEVDGTSGRKP